MALGEGIHGVAIHRMRKSTSAPASTARLLNQILLGYHRYMTVVSRQRGVGVTELLSLGHLRDSGNLTPGELGEFLGITSASVTALIDRLEREGYAHRLAHPRDRRSLLVELTSAGRAEIGTLFELPPADITTALRNIPAAEQTSVERFLNEIVACFDQHSAQIAAGEDQ